MTLDEYERIVGNRLVTAYNNKDMDALRATFRRADQTLEDNNVDPAADRREFWEKVRKIVYSGRLLLEKQANSALLALMKIIQTELDARLGKSK